MTIRQAVKKLWIWLKRSPVLTAGCSATDTRIAISRMVKHGPRTKAVSIDGEVIRFTDYDYELGADGSIAAFVLINCERGAVGTIASLHLKGSEVQD
ncbi:MAG: hypothetical protein ABI977_22065 [Acidobacteriota bacterium]